jgi:hypothetical protein
MATEARTSRPEAGTTSKAERRRGPRYTANPETACRVGATGEDGSQAAEIQNISATGLQVRLRRRYEVGTPCVVVLSNKDGSLPRTLMVQVTRVQEPAPGEYALGCAFVTPLGGHDLLALVL